METREGKNMRALDLLRYNAGDWSLTKEQCEAIILSNCDKESREKWQSFFVTIHKYRSFILKNKINKRNLKYVSDRYFLMGL